MLIYNGQVIAGGGTIVLPMTRAEYEANKAVLDTADVWVDLTDEADQVASADEIAYWVGQTQKGMGYIGDIATKAIAKVEPTDTALYLHAVGTYFINKDGNTCVTDVQIPVGGTITLNTNCHVVDGGISSNLTKNNFDTAVDLSSYNSSSNLYTFPCDGYVQAYADTDGSTYDNVLVYVLGRSSSTPPVFVWAKSLGRSGGTDSASLFVKKGMRCYVSSNGTLAGSGASFVPLIS